MGVLRITNDEGGVDRTRMKCFPLAVSILVSAPLFAQAPASSPVPPASVSDSDQTPELGGTIIKTEVTNVVTPVLVTDQSGNIIDGLQPQQFHLWDNGKEQNIHVDVAFEPISLVVAIECAGRVESLLPQVKHLGTLLPPIIGAQSEIAVVAFDHRLRTMQDFTSDPDKIKAAIDKINAGSSSSRMIDAVEKSVYMLRNRPKKNRKIIMLVSETRDMGSEGHVRETLIDANLSNVQIYTVDMTQFAVRLTEKRPEPRPVPMDPIAQNNPMGIPNTPTSLEVNYGMANRAQFVPLLKEIYTDVKGIFVANPAEKFANLTGGAQFYFVKQKGLEDAVQKISTDIHSQYLISYSPSNGAEPGFHTIEVSVEGAKYNCRARPGYWIAGGKR
jgi:VWFA-related protein